MSFTEAIQTGFRKYADFAGRATLPEFWWWMLFNLLVAAALNVFSVFAIGDSSSLGAVLTSLWGIGVLLPNLAVSVRRLRDADYNWKNIFWLLVPIAGIIVLVIYWLKPSVSTKPGLLEDS
ncbi:DUF805 domain-containing protein [Psychromicrobium lacuslunae]|uniref:DUF805 domain-containing protein n=1 Tax=Psychromicrobium lacuslunae TaxID=1618207 RepID=A0A0D4C136_9MICC|nr:DUF805 domain-containing protein [Psychromicrobium lacuslunae]AJT42269.1 hypothetical protein UM93_13590 [Psychromicrobium lacuslunae]